MRFFFAKVDGRYYTITYQYLSISRYVLLQNLSQKPKTMAAIATSRQQANPFDDSDDDEPAAPPPPPPPIDSPYNAMSPTITMSYDDNGADNAEDTNNGKILCLTAELHH